MITDYAVNRVNDYVKCENFAHGTFGTVAVDLYSHNVGTHGNGNMDSAGAA
jgi:hypothetical protein